MQTASGPGQPAWKAAAVMAQTSSSQPSARAHSTAQSHPAPSPTAPGRRLHPCSTPAPRCDPRHQHRVCGWGGRRRSLVPRRGTHQLRVPTVPVPLRTRAAPRLLLLRSLQDRAWRQGEAQQGQHLPTWGHPRDVGVTVPSHRFLEQHHIVCWPEKGRCSLVGLWAECRHCPAGRGNTHRGFRAALGQLRLPVGGFSTSPGRFLP